MVDHLAIEREQTNYAEIMHNLEKFMRIFSYSVSLFFLEEGKRESLHEKGILHLTECFLYVYVYLVFSGISQETLELENYAIKLFWWRKTISVGHYIHLQ
jgi:hypothetical protein